jgi:DNA-binding MarR family transcriptional regulator
LGDSMHERALLVEGLLPRVLRTMFKPDAGDPLADVPVGQMRMLRLLSTQSWTPSNLGEELGLSVSAVTQMANRLDSIGFVSRIEDPSDRRVKHLTLTPLGKEMMQRRQERRVHRLEQVLIHVPDSRQVEFIEMLNELLEAGFKASEKVDNSIFMEAEVEQKLPLPPAYAKEQR